MVGASHETLAWQLHCFAASGSTGVFRIFRSCGGCDFCGAQDQGLVTREEGGPYPRRLEFSSNPLEEKRRQTSIPVLSDASRPGYAGHLSVRVLVETRWQASIPVPKDASRPGCAGHLSVRVLENYAPSPLARSR